MSVKISRLALKSLWNSEYTIFISQIESTVEKYSFKELNLSKSYSKLKEFDPELAKIKAQEQSSKLSNLLSDYDSERDLYFNSINAQVKTLGKLSLPGFAENATILNRFIDIHDRDIADDTYNAETKRIDDFLADYNSKPDVKAAAQALNLAVLFDKMGEINKKFNDSFMQRTEETAAEIKVDARLIRKNVDKSLVEFFDAIEYCSREYEQMDYKPLANELNKLIEYYKTQLKARATRRSSGKDVSKELPIEVHVN